MRVLGRFVPDRDAEQRRDPVDLRADSRRRWPSGGNTSTSSVYGAGISGHDSSNAARSRKPRIMLGRRSVSA